MIVCPTKMMKTSRFRLKKMMTLTQIILIILTMKIPASTRRRPRTTTVVKVILVISMHKRSMRRVMKVIFHFNWFLMSFKKVKESLEKLPEIT